MTDATAPPGTNRWLVLLLVCFAQFMVVLDATIVNVALPSIQTDLGFASEDLPWVINAYTLLFGGFLLLGGRAADLFGRQRLFLAGIAVFSLASLVNALAQSAEVLVAGRALQGLGAALVSPAALSIITTTFEGPERTKALGIWSGIAAGGGAFGLLLGGILTEALSWEWVFLVNVPIGVLALALSARHVPNTRAEQRPDTVDVAGAVTVTAGLIVLVYALVNAQDWGWGSGRTLALGAAAVALLAGFVAVERRSRAPLIRLDVFRVRSLASGNAALLLAAAGMFASFYFGTLYLQRVLGFSPLDAGLGFLPVSGGIIAGAAVAQVLMRRTGVRPIALAGLALGSAGLLLLSRVTADGSYAADVLPPLLVMSVGMGLTFVAITLIATANVPSGDAGLASGIYNTAQQVGGALGLAVLSTLATDRTEDALSAAGGAPAPGQAEVALVEGFQVAYAGGAALLALGVVVLAVALRRRDVERIHLGEQPALARA